MSSINKIIHHYDQSMKKIWKLKDPGQIRSARGKLVEELADLIILCAWKNVGGNKHGVIEINPQQFGKKVAIPVQFENVPNMVCQDFTEDEIMNSTYMQKVDKHVYINDKFALAVECKSYTENAMLKRVLLDFSLLKSVNEDIDCCLLQMETQLGGNNDEVESAVYGEQSIALMSYFPNVNLNIISLLEGVRNIDKPIHKRKFSKELKPLYVRYAVKIFEKLLKKQIG